MARPAIAADAAAVLALHNAWVASADGLAAWYTALPPWTLADAERLLANPDERCWVQERAGAIVGFITFATRRNWVPLLVWSPTLPAARKVETAERLCLALLEHASSEGVPTVYARYPSGRAALRNRFSSWTGFLYIEAADEQRPVLRLEADVASGLSYLRGKYGV